MKKSNNKEVSKLVHRGTFLIFLGIILFGLNFCFNNKQKEDKSETITDAEKFKSEYESLNGKSNDLDRIYPTITIDKNNPIKYLTNTQVIKVIKEGSGIIYFGYPECPWCRSALPALLDVAKEKNINQIYYYNPINDRDEKILNEDGTISVKNEGTETYKKLLVLLNDYLDSYKGLNDETIKRLYVPFVLFVQNGKVVDYHSVTVKSQTDPYVQLSEDQYKELKNIYFNGTNKVYNDECAGEC